MSASKGYSCHLSKGDNIWKLEVASLISELFWLSVEERIFFSEQIHPLNVSPHLKWEPDISISGLSPWEVCLVPVLLLKTA